MFDVDWGRLFMPSSSLLEIFLRGSVIYLALFAVMRFLPLSRAFNMRREQVTEDEVRAQLRQHGFEHVEDVAAAYIEGDGHFSVLGRRGSTPQPTQAQGPRGAQGR